MGLVAQYIQQLVQLLPRGRALENTSGILGAILWTIARELERLHLRIDALNDEADPRTCNETIDEWERNLGLPDDCSSSAQTFAERRQAVVAKDIACGGQAPAYFVSLAKALGYDASIEEYRALKIGDTIDSSCYDDNWVHAFSVVVGDATPVRYSTIADACTDDPLATWGNEILECVISRAAPAHAVALFSYGE